MNKIEELKAKYQALQQRIESEYANCEPPKELEDELKAAIHEYQNAKAEAEKEANKKKTQEGAQKTMKKHELCNSVLKSLLMQKEVAPDMLAQSGIQGIVDAVGTVGNVESVGTRGGYLVPEEFLELDKYGNDIVMVPVRVIPVNLPKGKMPIIDMSQAKDGHFLAKYDELDTIGESNPVFGQVTFDCETYTGIVPVSNDLMDDNGDIMPVVSECFGLTSKAQQNIEVLKALNEIESPKTVKIANEKTMADAEAIDAIRTAILAKLSGINRASAKIVVCDSDFAKLATIKDGNGRPYLCQDVTNPSIYRLEGYEVVSIDDIYMTTNADDHNITVGGYAWVGNFERVVIFDRKGIEVSADASAMFAKDAIAVKGKKRFDVKVLEKGAFVKVS